MAAPRTRRVVDALAYALVVAAVTFALTAVAGVATGRGLVGAKWGMFVVGMTMLAYGAVRLRSVTPPWRRSETTRERPGTERSGVLTRVAPRLLPDDLRAPPGEAFPPGAKLLLAALAVLAGSLALEVVFGVGVPAT